MYVVVGRQIAYIWFEVNFEMANSDYFLYITMLMYLY